MKNSDVSLWELRKMFIEQRFPGIERTQLNSLLCKGVSTVNKNYMLTHYVPEIVFELSIKPITKKASFTNF